LTRTGRVGYLARVAAPAVKHGFFGLLRSGDVRALFSRYSDLALAGIVVGIVGIMIIPLPTPVLDLLVSLNIAFAVTLLLISIYVTDALKIDTFPTLLLLTTLFRLALEVSATRLILLKADAGEVIRAFGHFVVAGNLVVGAVIFLILTMIQFIVISKGSERVAEVAARFTLDAMPGKQMSIDGELRAGHIDHDEARRRRASLARESQLFGAMDGAMKFVKGDAIAGIVILAVNIVGGLIIGVVQRGMDAGAAARTYSILTIGEGLVSQIPALIISMSAGIVVTRVAAEDEGSHLGRDIGGQILAHPKAIAIAAGLLFVLGLVPGMPLVPFFILGGGFALVASRLLKNPPEDFSTRPDQGPERRASTADAGKPGAGASAVDLPSPVLAPIIIDLSPELSQILAPGGDSGRFVTETIPALRDRVFRETGIPLPGVRLRGHAAEVPPDGYVLRLNEVPMARGQAPRNGRQAAEDVIAEHLFSIVCRYGYELIGIQEAQRLVEGLERSHPALVREVIPKLVAPALLADVLRRLAEEGISLRNLREILGALAEWAPLERDPVALTEHVRAALRRAITHKHTQESGAVLVHLLDPLIEDTIRGAIHKTAAGSYLALEPEISRDILKAVGAAIHPTEPPAPPPVLLTNVDIRRYVRRLVEIDHPRLAVLSYQELAPEARIQPVARIRI